MLMAPAHDAVTLVRTLVVSHRPASVAEVRDAVARDLARGTGRRAVTPATVEDVVLVVSELVSNAVKHARPLPGGGIRVTWSVTPDGVEVSVTDGGAGTQPRVLPVVSSGTGGRGLGIVRALSSRWGTTEGVEQMRVWAVVDRAPSGEPPAAGPARVIVLPASPSAARPPRGEH